MPYKPPTEPELRQQWMGAVVATSETDDIATSGVAHSMVGMGSKLLSKAHARIEDGRRAFFGKGKGADLDQDCAQLGPAFRPRLGPTAAAGSVMQFIRSTTSGTQAVPAGVVVSSIDDPNVRFISTEPFIFADGFSTYPSGAGIGVRVACLSRGRGGNVSSGVIRQVVDSPVQGIIGCTNLDPLTNGLDRESNEALAARRQDFIAGLQGYHYSFFEYLAKSFIGSDGTRIQHAKCRTSKTVPGLVEILVDDGGGFSGTQLDAAASSGEVPSNGQRFFWFDGPASSDPLLVYDGVEYPVSGLVAKASFVIRHESGEGIVLPDSTLFKPSDAGKPWSVSGHKCLGGTPGEFQGLVNGRMAVGLELPGYRLEGLRLRVILPRNEWVSFRVRITPRTPLRNGDTIARVFQRVRDAIVAFMRELGPGDMLRLFDLIAAIHRVDGVKNFVILSPTGDVHPGDLARLSTRGNLIEQEG